MIFERDPRCFTFSIHQQQNYPFFKPRSDLDIGLEDGAGDDALPRRAGRGTAAGDGGRPELIVYVAGADPFEEDRLGGLRLTRRPRRARSARAGRRSAAHPSRVAVGLAGGYAERVEDTVQAHANTVVEVLKD